MPTPSLTVHIPRNESFKDIGSVGIFASRPGTPGSRSRTNSGSDSHFGSGLSFRSRLKGFTSIKPKKPEPASKADLDEVSKNLQAAMRERGRRRRSTGEAEAEEGWEFDVDRERSVTPYSDREITEEPGTMEVKKDV
jgi:glycerol-3-phosphate O-acyltransferase/dihydroxyacetone phosphate acyltransferase